MREPFQLYQRNGKWMARFWNEEAHRYLKTLTLDATDRQAAHDEAERRQREELPSRENPLLVDFPKAFWSDSGDYAKLKAIRGKALSPRYLALCRNAVKLACPSPCAAQPSA